MPEISDDDLGFLVWCAINYDRRLPNGRVPGNVWELLNDDWRAKINDRNSGFDMHGAQVRPRDGED